MKKKILIHEVAKLLDLDASTIRFWEKKGLLHLKRDKENGYRYFDNQSLIEVMDIIFFRNLQLPIKDLKSHQEATVKEREASFIAVKAELTELKKKIVLTEAILDRRIKATSEVDKLQNVGSKVINKEVNFKKIESFDLFNESHVRLYLSDPSSYTILFSGEDYTDFQEGITGTSETKNDQAELIWDYKDLKQIIYAGLLKIDAHNYKINNLLEISKILGYPWKEYRVIAQYLASGNEGHKTIDYYDCWFFI